MATSKLLSFVQRREMLRIASDLFYSIASRDVFCFASKTEELHERLDALYCRLSTMTTAPTEVAKIKATLRDAAKFLEEHIIGCDEIFSKHLLKNAQKIIDAAGRV